VQRFCYYPAHDAPLFSSCLIERTRQQQNRQYSTIFSHFKLDQIHPKRHLLFFALFPMLFYCVKLEKDRLNSNGPRKQKTSRSVIVEKISHFLSQRADEFFFVIIFSTVLSANRNEEKFQMDR
jgi:hypothetical protein